MPRAPSGLSLLLMAGLAFAATSPFEIVNPWLSASELQSASAAVDLRPGCSAPEPLCPPPCPANSTKSTQCLYYLQDSHKEEVCGRDLVPERRRDVLHGLRMRHCCEHAVDAALPEAAFQGGPACRRLLGALIHLDDLARKISCSHADLLTRYDCAQNYSIAHDCKDCKVTRHLYVARGAPRRALTSFAAPGRRRGRARAAVAGTRRPRAPTPLPSPRSDAVAHAHAAPACARR